MAPFISIITSMGDLVIININEIVYIDYSMIETSNGKKTSISRDTFDKLCIRLNAEFL